MSAYSGAVLADAPIGYWRLGEGPSATTAIDETANHRNGTYTASPTTGALGLLPGEPYATAMSTPGNTGAWASVPDDNAWDVVVPYTFEAWVSKLGATWTYFVGNNSWGFGVTNGMHPVFTRAGVIDNTDTGAVLTKNVTYHLACVFDAAFDASFYINGVFSSKALDTAAPATSASALLLGGFRNNADEWDGRVQDVAIYNYQLTAAQILSHYITGITLTNKPLRRFPLGV